MGLLEFHTMGASTIWNGVGVGVGLYYKSTEKVTESRWVSHGLGLSQSIQKHEEV